MQNARQWIDEHRDLALAGGVVTLLIGYKLGKKKFGVKGRVDALESNVALLGDAVEQLATWATVTDAVVTKHDALIELNKSAKLLPSK